MIESLSAGDLKISAHDFPDVSLLRLVWTGKSNTREPGREILPYFERLLPLAGAANRMVEMRFEEMDYFNSATISALLQVLDAARRARVRVTLVYDGQLKWQRATFEAFRALARKDEGLTVKEVLTLREP